MASWWHPQQQQQQVHHSTNEPFDYPPAPQSMPPPHPFYDTHMIMIEGNNNDEYLIHSTNNGNLNDSTSMEYHHRRNWYNG